MKNLIFLLMSLSLITIALLSPVIITAQTANIRAVVFNQGHWGDNDIDPGEYPNLKCTCGQAFYNCVCGLVSYNQYESFSEITHSVGQIYTVVSSQSIKGNSLKLKFKNKLDMNLKKNKFAQKEEVQLSSDLSSSLGYDSVTILPGKYTFKCRKSLTLNVRLGKKKS